MSAPSGAAIPVSGLRPHRRLLLDTLLAFGCALIGAAIALAGALLTHRAGIEGKIGWAVLVLGVVVTASMTALGTRCLRLRAAIEECGRRGLLRAFVIAEQNDAGVAFGALADGTQCAWRLDGRRPLLLTGDPPRLVGVEVEGGDGPPIGVAEDGFPFAPGPAVQDLLAAAEGLLRGGALPAEIDAQRQPRDGDAAPEIVRPTLPVARDADTPLARRTRRRILVVLSVAALLVILPADRAWWAMGLAFALVFLVAFTLGRRSWVTALYARATVDSHGLELRTRHLTLRAPWDRVRSVRVGTVRVGRSRAAGVSGTPGALAGLTGSDDAPGAAALRADPVVRRLRELGAGTEPVLPDVEVRLEGPPGRLHLRGTHDWHLAHAITAEATARGIDVEFA